MAGARPSSFGTQLRRYREAAGLSQEDLGERANLAAKAIGALERGERRRPYPRTVQMLADALQLAEAQRRQFIASVPRARAPAAAEGDLLVGRARELAELQAKLRAAANGHGGIVMLVGEAGIGKTRLAHEFMALARGQDAAVLSGRALEGEGQAPYGPWVEAIEQHAFAREPDGLRRDLGVDAAYIARLVPSIRSRLTDIPRPETLAPHEERLRLYGAVTRLCSAIAADRPVLVVLDDLHWADPDTLGLMRYLARGLSESSVLLVGVYRDPELGVDAAHPLMATLASLRHEIACPTIRLGGLDRREIETYLTRAAGRPLPATFVERIGRETSGNPFYAREVLRHVAEARAGASGVLADGDLEMTGVPEGVRQVVADRVRRLAPSTARALQDACGLTGGFTFPVLHELTRLSEGELLDSLDEAVEAGLLRAPGPGAREYEFAHAIVRHALYEAQGRERRMRLHRRIAAALEAAYSGHELEHAADLAVHYHASAELSGAAAGLRFALAAADQARSAFAHDRVVTLLRMARDLAREAGTGEQAEILARLAVAEAETVRSVEARDSADGALRSMLAAGASAQACAEFVASVAQALKHSGAGAQLWDPLIDRGLELAAGGGHDVLWARLTLLRDRYEGVVRSGPIGSGVWIGQDPEAVAVARGSGDESDYASTLEALEWRTRAETNAIRDRVRTWEQPVARLKGLEVVLRDLMYKHGDFTQARLVAEELLQLAQRFGSLSAEAEARAQLAVCSLDGDDFALASARRRDAERAIARLGPSHRLHLIPIGLAVGYGYYVDGDWKAIAETAEAYARTGGPQRTPMGIPSAGYATLAFARAGRSADARGWLRHLVTVCEGTPPTSYLRHWGLVAATVAAWECGFVDPADSLRRSLLEAAQMSAGPTTFGSIDLALARAATLLGAFDEAHSLFGRVALDAERSGHRALGAIVACDEVRMLARSGSKDTGGAHLLAGAISTFEALEMRGWVKRARSLGPEGQDGLSPAPKTASPSCPLG